eukprot:UN28079
MFITPIVCIPDLRHDRFEDCLICRVLEISVQVSICLHYYVDSEDDTGLENFVLIVFSLFFRVLYLLLYI